MLLKLLGKAAEAAKPWLSKLLTKEADGAAEQAPDILTAFKNMGQEAAETVTAKAAPKAAPKGAPKAAAEFTSHAAPASKAEPLTAEAFERISRENAKLTARKIKGSFLRNHWTKLLALGGAGYAVNTANNMIEDFQETPAGRMFSASDAKSESPENTAQPATGQDDSFDLMNIVSAAFSGKSGTIDWGEMAIDNMEWLVGLGTAAYSLFNDNGIVSSAALTAFTAFGTHMIKQYLFDAPQPALA